MIYDVMFFKKNKKYQSQWWSSEYPKTWKYDDDCVTFYDPNGVGALQISAYRKENNIEESEVLEFAEKDFSDTDSIKRADMGNFFGFHYEYVEDTTLWLKYHLWKFDTLLFVTYNCELQDKNEDELQIINNILKSIKRIT